MSNYFNTRDMHDRISYSAKICMTATVVVHNTLSASPFCFPAQLDHHH